MRRVVGREGKLTERLETGAGEGAWAAAIEASNALVDDLVRPVSEVGTGAVRGGRGRSRTADGPAGAERGRLGASAARRVPQGGPHRQRAGRPAVGVHRRGDAGGQRGRHGGQARRAGQGPGHVRVLEGPDGLREHHGVPADGAGARHRAGDDRGGQGRPVAQGHRARGRRDAGAEEHRQHDGRPAVVLLLRGDPGRPRGGHRGRAGRPGAGAGRGGCAGRTSRTRST